jgi:hypothetical protein
MYVELKTGYSHDGPAWIALVRFSKSGRSVYFRDRELRRVKGGGASANFIDVSTHEEFWVSGIKRRGSNRLFGSAPVEIEPEAKGAYERFLAGKTRGDDV